MRRRRFGVCLIPIALALITALAACGPVADRSTAVAEPSATSSESHVLEEIAPGVYFASASGTGKVNLASNAMVVVNADDVLVVDSHITPDAARGLIEAVRSVSEKPIRFLVNSHYHFDHAHGNQAFPPEIAIIGHEYTRDKLLGDPLSEATYQTIGSPQYESVVIAALEARVGEAADAESKASLEAQLQTLRRHVAALSEVDPTPPNVTLDSKMSLFRGDREIRIIHLGRGHTGGDLVVLLPKERIVFTGDLFYDGAPYLGDSFPAEFVDTLDRLKELDFDVAVPGHGPLVRDRSKIDRNQEYLRSYWRQVSQAHAEGLTAEQAADRLDLTGYEQFAAFQLGRREVLMLEVNRMYHLLSGG